MATAFFNQGTISDKDIKQVPLAVGQKVHADVSELATYIDKMSKIKPADQNLKATQLVFQRALSTLETTLLPVSQNNNDNSSSNDASVQMKF